jgi:signal transduction histidine kinase
MFVPMIAADKLVGALSLGLAGDVRRYEDADLAAARSIANRTALAIQNARLHEQVLAAKRLRDEVLGVVSHDLRNPLNTILLAAHALGRETSSPAVGAIVRATQYADGLIRDLLTATAIEGGSLPLDKASESIASIVQEAIALHEDQAASKSLALEASVDPELPAVSVDRRRVLQLLDNLIGNAFKFTAPSGRVRVDARRGEHSVVVRVSDTGSGIAPDALPHVFDRFWQGARSRRAGAGLGLAIAKGIVEAHGGSINVTSEEGRGTTFTFTLPAP